jgi:hypothetical protein
MYTNESTQALVAVGRWKLFFGSNNPGWRFAEYFLCVEKRPFTSGSSFLIRSAGPDYDR